MSDNLNIKNNTFRTAQNNVLDLRPSSTSADPLRAIFCWRLCNFIIFYILEALEYWENIV